MKYQRALSVAGLSAHESTIYVMLLEHGVSRISDIVRKTGLHRPTVYQYLRILQEKGLVGESKEGKRVRYVAESPDRVHMLFDDFAQGFKHALDDLKDLQQKDGSPVVKFEKGMDAISRMFYDLVTRLPKGGIFYRYSSSRDGKKAERYLPKDYRNIRDAKQLQRFVISNVRRAATKQPRIERSMRVVPSAFDWFEDDVTMLMYGDTVVYVDYNSETVTTIENSFIASFHIKLFKLLFQQL